MSALQPACSSPYRRRPGVVCIVADGRLYASATSQPARRTKPYFRTLREILGQRLHEVFERIDDRAESGAMPCTR